MIGFTLPLPPEAVRTHLMSTYTGLSISFVHGSNALVACARFPEDFLAGCADCFLQMIPFDPTVLGSGAEESPEFKKRRNGVWKDPLLARAFTSFPGITEPVYPLLISTPTLTDK